MITVLFSVNFALTVLYLYTSSQYGMHDYQSCKTITKIKVLKYHQFMNSQKTEQVPKLFQILKV